MTQDGDDAVPPPIRPGLRTDLRSLARSQRLSFLAAAAAWCFPLLTVGAFYTTWFTAQAVLGRTPRPSLDDPKSISILVDFPYVLAGVLIAGLPVWVIGGVCAVAWHARRTGRRPLVAVFRMLCLLALWAAALLFLRADQTLLDWYMD
jgi:hypothetical protein